ncbi:hypothetical protein [Dactylosporangium sp. CA-233914]|uniref:hypothetical protein n=1 Tax=Dactylosporangium sp. CA-233914 TaxID=3239934 RepID=UPI003D8DF363
MRNAQRILALGAMTLTAGAVLGMTATAASAATGQGGQATVAQPKPHGHGNGNGHGNDHGNNRRDRTWVAGWYQSKKTCEFFAWIGERQGRFDDGKCVPSMNRKHGWLLIAHDYGRRGHR